MNEARAQSATEPAPARGVVLVADDSRLVRALLGQHLRDAGYEVELVEDGAAALRLIGKRSFDVAVTDLEMPELDGFALLEEVKKRGLSTEIVILTGAHDISAAIRALRLGAHDFLTKPPSSPDEIVLTVDRAVEKKRLREANARLLRELEVLSRSDPLTGLPNRRVFDEAIAREVSRAVRYGYPVSLVMLDIDHFKKVNDTHGHQAGDAVLTQFARLVVGLLRESDAVHRYGGEEFAVLLAHTPLDGALHAARRIVERTAGTPFDVGQKTIDVTVSAGAAALQGATLSRHDLVALADRALYHAKHDGRNRVCVAESATATGVGARSTSASSAPAQSSPAKAKARSKPSR